MPKKLLVIGSGAIGIEFASFFNTLGAETTVVEVLDRILPVEDAEIGAFAKKQFEKQGMKIMAKAMVKKLDRANGKVTAHIEANGKTEAQEFDTVISAVGIVGNTEGLGLEKLGVKVEKTHIVTDAYNRTGVDGIYAIGDVAGAALARAQGQPRGRDRRRADRRQERRPPARPRLDRRLHLLPAADRQRRPDRGQGQGGGAQDQGRPLPLHRQRQGHRAGRARGHDQDHLRRGERASSWARTWSAPRSPS